jgi:hypothetical protein
LALHIIELIHKVDEGIWDGDVDYANSFDVKFLCRENDVLGENAASWFLSLMFCLFNVSDWFGLFPGTMRINKHQVVTVARYFFWLDGTFS